MSATLFDDRQCALGEGPLWHPERKQLYWFDILGNRLLTVEDGEQRHWQFDEHVSAAGWTGPDTLLIASEIDLFHFDLTNGKAHRVCELEKDNPLTRSNDGRADPAGGFWIGTMGKKAELGAGAVYRLYKGELRKIYPDITIPNSICFCPQGDRVYFCDTPTRQIMTQGLDTKGWPKGDIEVFADLRADGLNPDGSVTDENGNLWNAQWGAARVASYGTDGQFLQSIGIPGRHSSCPAFGGPDLKTLYCTSARQDLTDDILAAHPENGQTFATETDARGWPEPQVFL